MPFNRDSQLIFERYVVLNEKVSSEAVLKALDEKDEQIAQKLFELDVTPSKGHAVKLAKFFNQIKRIEVIQDYYRRFLDLKKRNRIKDITQYEKFSDLENDVDNLTRTVRTTTEEPVQDEPPVYEDDNIIVQQSNTRARCVKFGSEYQFCISKTVGSNMFSTYRLQEYAGAINPTFYFVWSKKRPQSDNKHIIVIGAGKAGTWNRTFADNHTIETEPGRLIGEVPELKPAFDKDVFKHVPLSGEEKQKVEKFDALVRDFTEEKFNKLNYDEKAEFLQLGSVTLTPKFLSTFNKELRNEYLKNLGSFQKELIPILTPSEAQVFRKQMMKKSDTALELIQYVDKLKAPSNEQ